MPSLWLLTACSTKLLFRPRGSVSGFHFYGRPKIYIAAVVTPPSLGYHARNQRASPGFTPLRSRHYGRYRKFWPVTGVRKMSGRLFAVAILFFTGSLCLAQQTAPPPATPTAAPQAQGPKKRVAIMNFDYGTVMTSVQQIFGSNQDVGKGISDLLVMRLVNDGRYSVIERAALDKVLTEQNFSNSDRADPTSAAKIGKILGIDAMIIGSITQFGRDDKSTTVGGGGYGLGRFGLGGVKSSNAKAVVAVTARVIDTNTAEILAACEGYGESTRSGTSLVGGGGGAGGGGGGLDMSSSNFGATILGEAVHKAVDSLGQQLDDKSGALPTHKVEIAGLVADVSGNQLILNVGSNAGVKIGDTLAISRPVRTVKDPATGKVLKTITNKIGDATVTQVDADSATATLNSSTPAQVGDNVSNE
jgi:curli biogenesis system outer membrane secretion channel CsgG